MTDNQQTKEATDNQKKKSNWQHKVKLQTTENCIHVNMLNKHTSTKQ